MADNENLKRPLPPRRNTQQNRPTPGVQKAIQTFGVRDLREILDKKRQEQGDSQRPDPKLVKLPPPDPSYNYLKDPTRDKPRSPRKKSEDERQYDRPIARDRTIPPPQYKQDKFNNRDRDQDSVQPERVYSNRDFGQQEFKESKNSNIQEKGVLKNRNQNFNEGAPKKELRFSDNEAVVEQSQFSRGGRRSFRGRNLRRGGGGMSREEKIEKPFNIKIELSTETGLRNCVVDESTKIADIKHVPDKIPHQRALRGGFRGNRGNLRGRGGFRGWGEFSYKRRGAEPQVDRECQDHTFNMKELKQNLPEDIPKDCVPSVDNGNDNDTLTENNPEDFEEDYDQENDEYNDANENYEDEFPNEYFSEYHNSEELEQNLNNVENYESLPKAEIYGLGASDPNLQSTITITSSKFQDGEVKRSIEVVEKDMDGQENINVEKEGK